MTHRSWSHFVHHWHPPHPRAPRLPRLRLSRSQVAALRQGVIVALCALLAGSLTCHWSIANRGAILPSSSAAAGGA
ncbi:MAG: hypothetical protein NDI82_13135 [Anaeromyxobacteraceae bacterium]|nr:hypothetical protein [Anaeromyxobacteraceae bacterium]